MSHASDKPAPPSLFKAEQSDTSVPSSVPTDPYLPPVTPDTPVEPKPPRILGEYELLEPLGAGGMGEVYRARHRRLGKLVALKLLARGTQRSPQRVARFLREMRAIGELDHPNVVEAHDAGEQDGIIYLVMKLVPGTDLSTLVRQRGPFPVAEACELIRQAAVGLHYLHERGLVHRDIKPSNLMRTPEGVVKILDLGLARWLDTLADGEALTDSGQPMGTPDYLAPEQARSATEVDVRADLYGLGATLFCLLTGHAPFAHRTGVYEKLWAHQTEMPVDVRSQRAEVPAALAEYLSRLLAKRPQDRPDTPAEVAAALAPFAAGLQGTADPLPVQVTPLPRHPVGKKSRAIALSIACLGLLLLMALPAGLNQHPPRDEPVNQVPSVEKVEQPPQQEPVRIVSLDVQHFASIEREGRRSDQPAGLLGKDSFETYLEDSVAVATSLAEPAYSYLIAFRPNGVEELCYPEDAREAPILADHLHFPSSAKGTHDRLQHGEGMHVFALVVSRQPLPPYGEWRAQRGPAPWKTHEMQPGVVWRFDGKTVEPRLDPDLLILRGKSGRAQDSAALAELMDWLRRKKDVAGVGAVAFPVRVKNKL